jgi:hypothetical protein
MRLDHRKTVKKTRIKLYNTLTLPAVLRGSENWTIKYNTLTLPAVLRGSENWTIKYNTLILPAVLRGSENWTIKYNTLTLPAVVRGNENWTIKSRYTRRITAAEVKNMRKTAGYSWTDCKTNAEISNEPNITQVFGQSTGIHKKLVATYKQNALQ